MFATSSPYITHLNNYKMKNYLSLIACLLFTIINLQAQSQQEVESTSSDVATFKSTTGVTTTINLSNDGDLPAGGAINNRRGYIETRANDVIVGASSNNTGGDIILKLPATSLGRIMLANNTTNHVVMKSNGDLGIGTDTPSAKLDVDGQARIRNLPAGGATDQFVTADASGNLRKVSTTNMVLEYFIALPNGIQTLLDAGESPMNIINGGAALSDFYGLNYAGGIIFYMTPSGNGAGLVAATEDQGLGSIEWGCSGTVITGADGTIVGTGAQNTNDIELGCTTPDIAANLCANLILNGYNDWFLPSKNELNEMYINIGNGAIGPNNNIGGFLNSAYWSSSEFDANSAWAQSFSTGSQVTRLKFQEFSPSVRAIRSF